MSQDSNESNGVRDIAAVAVDQLQEVDGMKLLLEVNMQGERLSQWTDKNAGYLGKLLEQNGALLIRGLKINSSKQFGALLEAVFEGPLLEYVYRSTPRTGLKGNVYTATEYSAEEVIPQHNENAYSRSWPNRIGFLCMLPSETGGETPISDTRYIYKNLPQHIIDSFEQKGIKYVRNYSNIDLPWTEVFQTDDKATVEQYCRDNEMDFKWIGDDQLRTTQVNPAVVKHPKSGEKLWFNQAHLFHLSSLSEDVRETMMNSLGEDKLPRNTYYGDGSPIDEKDLAVIRRLYEESKIRFTWQKNDVMLLDNMLFTHGRESFTGARKVLTGMAVPNQKP